MARSLYSRIVSFRKPTNCARASSSRLMFSLNPRHKLSTAASGNTQATWGALAMLSSRFITYLG